MRSKRGGGVKEKKKGGRSRKQCMAKVRFAHTSLGGTTGPDLTLATLGGNSGKGLRRRIKGTWGKMFREAQEREGQLSQLLSLEVWARDRRNCGDGRKKRNLHPHGKRSKRIECALKKEEEGASWI